MIQFEEFQLSNGLRFIFHPDTSTPMVAFNVLYDVGAKDEDPEKTGFAHLFEHLMFGGSLHIPNYDTPLQIAGGENNAYTTNDLTNYYIQLPHENIETAFWLESDRMLSLAFDPTSLEVQKKVVCEEFKEHYINKPYGDAWKHLRELCFEMHPYQWMTIGKSLDHIENATLDDVKAFFFKHYNPQNAIVCVAGNTTLDTVKHLAEKWFAPIPAGEKYVRNLPSEPIQQKAKHKTVEANVPLDALYKAYKIDQRLSRDYYAVEILSEILSGGQSSVLYHNLVKEQQLFSNISCYSTGSIEPGLLIIEGKVIKEHSIETAHEAVEKLLNEFVEQISAELLEKAIHKIEAMITFEDMNLLARANNLAYYKLLGNVHLMNQELEKYNSFTVEELKATARKVFSPSNSNTLFYKSIQKTGELVLDDNENEEEA